MNNLRILVGVVTRNRADILSKAIDSALAQTAVQVAVIDDGSTDATIDLPGKYPQVLWTRRSVSLGYMRARNELMGGGVFDYFVSLDDDAWFLSGDEIAVAVAYLERNRSVAAVAFDILSPDRPTIASRTEATAVAMFIGCGHVLRLTTVSEVGVYESVPGAYGGEEKDLCLRLMDAGYQIMRLPGVHVWHDKTHMARNVPSQHRSGVCNDLVMTLRRTPIFLLPLALVVKSYRHGVYSWRNNLLRPCLGGFGDFIRSSIQVWRSRKPVRIATIRTYMRLSQS